MEFALTIDRLQPVPSVFAAASVRAKTPPGTEPPTIVIQKGGRPVHPLQDARLSREARDALTRLAQQPLVFAATHLARKAAAMRVAAARTHKDDDTTLRGPRDPDDDGAPGSQAPERSSPAPRGALGNAEPATAPLRGQLIDLLA